MAKSFVELKYRRKTYKLRANDINRVFKSLKRPSPAIPHFDEKFKTLPDTDIDIEVPELLEGWTLPLLLWLFTFFVFTTWRSIIDGIGKAASTRNLSYSRPKACPNISLYSNTTTMDPNKKLQYLEKIDLEDAPWDLNRTKNTPQPLHHLGTPPSHSKTTLGMVYRDLLR